VNRQPYLLYIGLVFRKRHRGRAPLTSKLGLRHFGLGGDLGDDLGCIAISHSFSRLLLHSMTQVRQVPRSGVRLLRLICRPADGPAPASLTVALSHIPSLVTRLAKPPRRSAAIRLGARDPAGRPAARRGPTGEKSLRDKPRCGDPSIPAPRRSAGRVLPPTAAPHSPRHD